MRALVSRAEEAGVAPAASTYTLLLSSLSFEGRTEEAEALRLEMTTRGIQPTEHTAKALARSAEELSKQRTAELGRLLRAGESHRAWELFDGLLERGHANEYQLTTMLRWACSTTAERLTLNKRIAHKRIAHGLKLIADSSPETPPSVWP